MGQLRCSLQHHHQHFMITSSSSSSSTSTSTSPSAFPFSLSSYLFQEKNFNNNKRENQRKLILSEINPSGLIISDRRRRRRRSTKYKSTVVVASSNSVAPLWESWKPDKAASAPSFSDVLWPSAGAFMAMAILGKMDQVLARRGISMTIAPLGAVSAVLFATPSSPAAKKYNMFMAQIGCAAIGVVAFSFFGPGWLARSVALAASIAFMIYTRSTHPPAASLPLLFIDGPKLHHLNLWYAVFPGATGCILLCLIQEVVCYLKDNFKF